MITSLEGEIHDSDGNGENLEYHAWLIMTTVDAADDT